MSIGTLNINRIVRSVSEIFKQGLVLTDEQDQWFKSTFDHLNEVERTLTQMQTEVRFLSEDRKDLGKAMIGLNRSISVLAICEESTVLSLTLDKLADLQANSSTLQNFNAEMDYQLVRILTDQIEAVKHFKERILSRSRAWQNLKSNEQLLRRKREIKVQHYLVGKLSRLEQEKKEINELNKHVSTLREDLMRMDEQIRIDYEGFTKQRLVDIKESFINWCRFLEESEQKILESWYNLSKGVSRTSG